MLRKLTQGKPMVNQAYHVEDGILRKYVTDDKGLIQVIPDHYT